MPPLRRALQAAFGSPRRLVFPYSERSAIIGSIVTARRAGTRLAATDTAMSSALTVKNTVGSRGDSSNSSPSRSLADTSAIALAATKTEAALTGAVREGVGKALGLRH